MLRLTVVGDLRVAGHRLGPEPGGGDESLEVIGELGESEALGVIRGFVLTSQNGCKPLRQGRRRKKDGGVSGKETSPGLSLSLYLIFNCFTV